MHRVENFPFYCPTHLLKKLGADELSRWEAATGGVLEKPPRWFIYVTAGIKRLFILFFSCCFQSSSVRFASWDEWHCCSGAIQHKVLRAPHLAVCEGVALPASCSQPHWDRHRPHAVRQALLPPHLQLHQTGVQETSEHLLKKTKSTEMLMVL